MRMCTHARFRCAQLASRVAKSRPLTLRVSVASMSHTCTLENTHNRKQTLMHVRTSALTRKLTCLRTHVRAHTRACAKCTHRYVTGDIDASYLDGLEVLVAQLVAHRLHACTHTPFIYTPMHVHTHGTAPASAPALAPAPPLAPTPAPAPAPPLAPTLAPAPAPDRTVQGGRGHGRKGATEAASAAADDRPAKKLRETSSISSV